MRDGASVGWRLMDLVHVLAQLPASLRLDLEGEADQIALARVLARAYGLDGRVGSTESGRTCWRFGGASRESAWAEGESLDSLPDTMAEVVESLSTGGDGDSVAPEGGAGGSQDQPLSGHRVAIVTNLPTHYRVPLFTGLARRLEAAGGSLRVFFLASGTPDRPWLGTGEDLSFDHEFLRSIPLPLRRRRRPFMPFDLRRRLGAYDPTILVAAGFSPFSALTAAAHARRRDVPFGIWSGETPALAPRKALRAAQRRRLVERADFGIAYGSLAVQYLRSLAPQLPVVIGRNTSVTGVRQPRREKDREPLELIAVADLAVPGKGMEMVVEALGHAKDVPCRLSVIGTRPAPNSALDQSIRDDRIRYLGPLSHGEVMAALGESDVFLFPSRVDPFGLALAEAMASEVAAIVSPAPGAVADLAVSGHNCLVVDRDDPQSWAGRIRELADDGDRRRVLATHARETIARRWTIDHAVEGMMAGLRLGAMTRKAR